MASNHNLDDIECLQTKLDRTASGLCREKPGFAPLQVSRIFEGKIEEDKTARCCVRNQDVWDGHQLEALKNNKNDISQIFIVRQERSLTYLNISLEILQCLMSSYNIFPQFWKCLLAFGCKESENEFEFPNFRARRSQSSDSKAIDTYESSFILRRAELNGREPQDDDSAMAAWSIRQTAVYSRIEFCSNPRSMFVLISPSKNMEEQLSICLDHGVTDELKFSPWNVERMLVGDSLRGWMDYMACLERQLKRQSNRIVLAKVGSEKDHLSPLTDFYITFIDRQELKILEDQVIDLQVILPTLLRTVVRIREETRNNHIRVGMTGGEGHSVDQIIDEFDEYVRDAETHIERAKVLQDRVNSTAKLLSDLLSYEEAIALKDLAKESHEESHQMRQLTERSTKDAASVKILTVIFLIYLPLTIVANFFSTQFVRTNDNGHMSLSVDTWLLAAIALPLTAVTIILWWAWVYFTKVVVPQVPSSPETAAIQRQSSFLSFTASKRKKRQIDEESGLHTLQSRTGTFPVPFSFQNPGVGTWSTTATTIKPG